MVQLSDRGRGSKGKRRRGKRRIANEAEGGLKGTQRRVRRHRDLSIGPLESLFAPRRNAEKRLSESVWLGRTGRIVGGEVRLGGVGSVRNVGAGVGRYFGGGR